MTRLLLHTAAFITVAPGATLLLVPAIIIALAGATLAPTPVAAIAGCTTTRRGSTARCWGDL